MSFESRVGHYLPEETVFNAEEGAPIPFRLHKVIPRPGIHCYTVTLGIALDEEHLERVIALARQATAKLGSIDDLDVSLDVNKFPVDPTLFRFTHALEHLTTSHLAKLSLYALFQIKLSKDPAAKTTVYQGGGNDQRFFIGFSLKPNLAPLPTLEQESVQNACLEVSQLQ